MYLSILCQYIMYYNILKYDFLKDKGLVDSRFLVDMKKFYRSLLLISIAHPRVYLFHVRETVNWRPADPFPHSPDC